MKNRSVIALICATCVFLAFVLGFFCGRSSTPSPIQIAALPQPVRTVAVEESSPASAVASVAETVAQPSSEGSGYQKININTATAAQLETLPGIGPVLAQRILDYREHNGPFTALAQLTFVNGIGEKRLMEIMDLITVE